MILVIKKDANNRKVNNLKRNDSIQIVVLLVCEKGEIVSCYSQFKIFKNP